MVGLAAKVASLITSGNPRSPPYGTKPQHQVQTIHGVYDIRAVIKNLCGYVKYSHCDGFIAFNPNLFAVDCDLRLNTNATLSV